eukprot:SAG22_NODE_297_length_12786_cov_3.360290_3_plen_81_part_00
MRVMATVIAAKTIGQWRADVLPASYPDSSDPGVLAAGDLPNGNGCEGGTPTPPALARANAAIAAAGIGHSIGRAAAQVWR